jgi:hypothetical protein
MSIRSRLVAWNEKQRQTGEIQDIKRKDVRKARRIATLGVVIAFTGLIAYFNLRTDAAHARQVEAEQHQAEAEYQSKLTDYNTCWSRVKSTGEIDAVNKAGVAHARETAKLATKIGDTFDGIVDQIEQSGRTSPTLTEIRAQVDSLQSDILAYNNGVQGYENTANTFVPQDPATCPPKPQKP